MAIKLLTDTLTKSFIIKASPSRSFVYGNLLWLQVCPAAYLLDLTTQKRFYYGRSVFLDTYDSIGVIRPQPLKFLRSYFSKSFRTKKGQMNLILSLPWVNSFFLQPQDEHAKVNTWFWGISAGLEYFYRDDEYLGLTANAVMDLFMPVPAAIDISGEYELMSSVYLSFTNNYKFRDKLFKKRLGFSIL